ncbi:hypothetical protein DSF51_21115 [Salmonella enterica subsp. enterica serovar Sarajane]|uniref:hypothetical protein n=1 Tax=Salmonella enterica TaxID=28901 RepID=UPI0009B04DD6|nr:hypothetical protein [Salmonella enterica]EBX5008518.1 hypothetical protein [Salmonella enterica subsp. enterica serovar Sarajane]EAA8311644.1 hypothetical protein [Salmonella enterica subsp. enterica serovar Chandans]MIP20313.1 hypothetical protein [Salmonella enterica subsp. enterica serovar Chandans]QIY52082.1 hypothetical protein FOC17_18615 [Salmonella enterica]HAK8871730.1 hypothetical protein [Salmonella enterica]
MKRFKEIAAILLFALLAAGFTSSAMASSGSGGGPWDFDFSGPWLFCKLQQPDSLQLPPPPGEYCWH